MEQEEGHGTQNLNSMTTWGKDFLVIFWHDGNRDAQETGPTA